MIRPRGVSERRKPSPGRAAGALVCARVSWPPGDAVAGPLGDEAAFEVRDGAEDVEDKFAARSRSRWASGCWSWVETRA